MAQTIDLGRVVGEMDALAAYPVGSFYISAQSTSPASLFGGTWEQIKDSFLLAAGDDYAAGTTGGEAEHLLSESEMPSHRHNMEYSTDGSETFSAFRLGREGTATGSGNYGGTSEGVTSFSSYAIQIRSAGGDVAHNNMPPYLAVYVWKRVS